MSKKQKQFSLEQTLKRQKKMAKIVSKSSQSAIRTVRPNYNIDFLYQTQRSRDNSFESSLNQTEAKYLQTVSDEMLILQDQQAEPSPYLSKVQTKLGAL